MYVSKKYKIFKGKGWPLRRFSSTRASLPAEQRIDMDLSGGARKPDSTEYTRRVRISFMILLHSTTAAVKLDDHAQVRRS